MIGETVDGASGVVIPALAISVLSLDGPAKSGAVISSGLDCAAWGRMGATNPPSGAVNSAGIVFVRSVESGAGAAGGASGAAGVFAMFCPPSIPPVGVDGRPLGRPRLIGVMLTGGNAGGGGATLGLGATVRSGGVNVLPATHESGRLPVQGSRRERRSRQT